MPIIDRPVVLHQGVYKKTATTAEAVFMITGMTIGAGILGLPYAVAKVGLPLGLGLLVALGLVSLGLNLMIGELAVRAGEPLQLPGLAGKFLGWWAKEIVSITLILRSYGALLAYLVGAGLALSALFGGPALAWSVIFWSIGGFLILGGLTRLAKAERIVSSLVMALIVLLSLYILPHVEASTLWLFKPAEALLPIGVILFALSATPAIGEAHALLRGDERKFKKALIIGTILPIVIYALFMFAVVGSGGSGVTEVATVGLGLKFGTGVLIVANLFAVLAMSTGFMGLGTALKETIMWDYKQPKLAAVFLVAAIPLSLLLLGFHSFVTVLEVVGGLLITLESAVMVLVYWRARRAGAGSTPVYPLHQALLISLPVLLFFLAVFVYNIFTLIIK